MWRPTQTRYGKNARQHSRKRRHTHTHSEPQAQNQAPDNARALKACKPPPTRAPRPLPLPRPRGPAVPARPPPAALRSAPPRTVHGNGAQCSRARHDAGRPHHTPRWYPLQHRGARLSRREWRAWEPTYDNARDRAGGVIRRGGRWKCRVPCAHCGPVWAAVLLCVLELCEYMIPRCCRCRG